MKKNEDRKLTEQVFLEDKGRITNKELARRTGVHPATIARWRRLDEWDAKLDKLKSEPEESDYSEEDFFQKDVRHIRLLNERIDAYLERQQLLPIEIRELAQAKLQLVSCMEIITNHMRYPLLGVDYEGYDEEFD